MRVVSLAVVVCFIWASSCTTLSTTPRLIPIETQHSTANASITALQKGKFADASRFAQIVLKKTPHNVYGRAVKAITDYKQLMHDLVGGLRIIVVGTIGSQMLNRFFGNRSSSISGLDAAYRLARTVLEKADKELDQVHKDLIAAAHPDFHLELCLACWEVDWSGSGEINRFDRHLLEIERNSAGEKLDEDDPRRKPTFRFDHGDLLWAQAFLSFQRAFVNMLLAYRWSEAKHVLRDGLEEKGARLVFHLIDASRIAVAREQLQQALVLADKTRRAYLAETDDDREWVPNPHQKNHPLPLPVDDALYRTWEGVIHDLRLLIDGKAGLSVAELAQLGEHQWKKPPRGYLNLGKMLSQPRDIVIEPEAKNLERAENIEATLAKVFGDCYTYDIKPSFLIKRLQRMKREMDAGKESFDRKLRYLFWLN